jgi:hypothetical protein
MLPSDRKLVQEIIDRLSHIEVFDLDSLDIAELMNELEEEFGPENLKWAVQFRDALRVARGHHGPAGKPDPMWDRDLDG